MDKVAVANEILNLVDLSPMDYVDISSILEKYSEGQDTFNQAQPRVSIIRILRELRNNGEIEYMDEDAAKITMSQYGQFVENSLLIKGTYKRQKEIENRKEGKPFSIHFEDNSIKAREIGILVKDSQFRDLESRPNINPGSQTKPIIPTKAKYPLPKWIIKHIWQIVSGVIIVLISSYIIYHYHLFQK